MAHEQRHSTSTASSTPRSSAADADRSEPARVRHVVHVNFLWRSLDDVSYTRMSQVAPGPPLNIRDVESTPAPPESEAEPPSTLVSRDLLLKTQAFDVDKPVYLRCYHYDFKGCCQRGLRCCFAHIVAIGDRDGPIRRRTRYRSQSSQPVPAANVSRNHTPAPPPTVSGPAPTETSHLWWFHDPYRHRNEVDMTPFIDDP